MRSAVRAAAALGTAVLLGSPTSAGAQEPDAPGVLEAAAEAYARTDALCASFVQELSVPLLGEERTGRGRMCQAQPDRFAMRFTEPPGDLVVADGSWVWIYYPSLDPKQVLRARLGDGGAGGFDFHRAFLSDPADKYEVSYEGRDQVGDHEVHLIRLVPRAPASYRYAVVAIDADAPVLRRVRIEEENGTVRTVTLDDIDTRPDIDAGWFTFTPPADAVVVTR